MLQLALTSCRVILRVASFFAGLALLALSVVVFFLVALNLPDSWAGLFAVGFLLCAGIGCCAHTIGSVGLRRLALRFMVAVAILAMLAGVLLPTSR